MATDDSDIVVLTSENTEITGSKMKLAAASKYFNAMFNSEVSFVERDMKTIDIKEVETYVLKVLVQYSEDERSLATNVSRDNAFDLLSGACMLQFEMLIEEMTDICMDFLGIDNCLTAVSVADTCGRNVLYNTAKATSLWYFEQIAQTSEELLDVPLTFLTQYLSDTTLNATSELSVYSAVERWVQHSDEGSRKQHFRTLFSLVHLDFMSPDDLKELLKRPLLVEDQVCRSKVLTTLENYRQAAPARSVPSLILACGGTVESEDGDVPNCDLLAFDSKGPVEPLTSLPHPCFEKMWGHKIAVLGKDLYVSGGEVTTVGMRRHWYYDIWRYDSLNADWSVVGELKTPRRHHSVLARGRYLYFIGGFGKHRVVQDTVERWDVETGEVTKMPNLNTPVYSAAVCYCDNAIYVIKNSVEVLPDAATRWQQLSVPGFPFEIGIHTALPYGGVIYCMGLHSKRLVKVDPEKCQMEDVGCFQNCVGFGCLANGKIYAVFGEDSGLVETYDIATGKFDMLCCSEVRLKGHCVVTLPKYPNFR